ncbi:MAG: hypothetical protein PW789_05855 [Edaphobacter sp.]|uniref:hypothetical protein n=1 Tax=Edaphobacter sp. TaxID=1934404 RepID=UPI0023976B4E|nr:hypothetical protein [Edaphobacter sp.]MDE1176116.1 hypothetical protein [Edaphobacter sp.]
MGFARQPMVHGTVTTVAADKLTIKTDAGDLYTVAVTPNTRLLKENRLPGAAPTDGPRQPQLIKIEEIKPGDGIGATGELDAPNKTLHALFVAVMDAAQVKRLREGMGKEYITGKVTAMDETKLTIQRADNVTQVIEVDETTSFRRGGRRAVVRADGSTSPLPSGPQGTMQGSGNESITLADLKVGDMIAGQGSLKHGVFVPTTLTVVPPGAMGGPRMRREGQPPAGAAAPAQTAPNQ